MAEPQNPRIVYQVTSKPGFSRDGTVLDRESYIDGQWVRFQRGRPRKMGGFKETSATITDLIRGAYVYSRGKLEYIYGFGAARGWLSTTTPSAASSVAASSSLPGLTDADDYTFQTDAIFDATGGGTSNLLVHPASNIEDIASTVNTPVYYCDIGVNPATYQTVDNGSGGMVEVSGGIVVLQPYVFAYGNNGLIKNSNPNAPNDWTIAVGNDANEVNVAGTKIVKGLAIRGGANSPAGLFWALDSLIRVSRVGGDFRYDPISSQTTILAPNSAIEYDGVYYWLGVDRFFSYTGTVNELANGQNYNWFFDNVNYSQRAKIWAMKNTRFGEIWWFFPFGEATECTHALIYNVREGYWYDVELPRSSGASAGVFRYPVAFGSSQNNGGMYSTFVHEFGIDRIQGGDQTAIPAFVETSDFGYPTGGAEAERPVGADYWTRLTRIEPDFIQEGEMTVQVVGGSFANSPAVESLPFPFDQTTGKIDLREQRRQIRLRFTSNVSGGTFQMGRVILHLERGDIRS